MAVLNTERDMETCFSKIKNIVEREYVIPINEHLTSRTAQNTLRESSGIEKTRKLKVCATYRRHTHDFLGLDLPIENQAR